MYEIEAHDKLNYFIILRFQQKNELEYMEIIGNLINGLGTSVKIFFNYSNN
jgi:hypothetical protein